MPAIHREKFLLAASLFLYFFASPDTFVILFSVCLVSSLYFLVGKGMPSLWHASFAILIILMTLLIFKYLDFLTFNLFQFLNIFGFAAAISSQKYFGIVLPIGISFYCFQAISFIIDLHKEKNKKWDIRVSRIFLYISFFPQLLAGPIVKFRHFYREVRDLKSKKNDLLIGTQLICIGLAKKLLLADFFAVYVDIIYSLPPSELSWKLALLGPFLFFFQIYFDFSGYSDLAIGIARLFGIKLLKNFRLPYLSVSITEFWRRWHISLSSWFKQYLYIPLGGNKVSLIRNILNLFIVFAICGFWHGANWVFVLWGLWNGIFLTLERFFRKLIIEKISTPSHIFRGFSWVYTFTVIVIGWALFRSNDLAQFYSFLFAVFELKSALPSEKMLWVNFDLKFYVILGISIFISLGGWRKCLIYLQQVSDQNDRLCRMLENISLISILLLGILSLSTVARGTFSSFIYFQF